MWFHLELFEDLYISFIHNILHFGFLPSLLQLPDVSVRSSCLRCFYRNGAPPSLCVCDNETPQFTMMFPWYRSFRKAQISTIGHPHSCVGFCLTFYEQNANKIETNCVRSIVYSTTADTWQWWVKSHWLFSLMKRTTPSFMCSLSA